MRYPIICLLYTLVSCSIYGNFETDMLAKTKSFLRAPDELFDSLFSTAVDRSVEKNHSGNFTHSRPLFKKYPMLSQKIPCLALGNLPTLVHRAQNLEQWCNCQLYIKRDDMTNCPGQFGGNKLRKLEFMLADALARGYHEVITFGCAGSNLVAATAWYANMLGLRCIAFVKPQINSHVVRRNLLCNLCNHLGIVPVENNADRTIKTTMYLKDSYQKNGKLPYVIPTGASWPLGALGYVNAAFELKEQIDSGMLPMPDFVYLPLGSAGTMVGLLIGFKAAGISSKIIGVTVEPEEVINEFHDNVHSLFVDTVNFIRHYDPNFPLLTLRDEDFEILYDHAGDDYALFTQEAIDAVKLMNETEGLTFDGIYSGKAMAGMLADLKKRENYKTVLFWLTFCGDSFNDQICDLDYHALPAEFYRYFEQEVQDLDIDKYSI